MVQNDAGFKGVRVRFAPSPTGAFHWGTARTALFNWLFARHHNGKFIVRIDDTDAERSKKIYEDQIFSTLKWLKIPWDEEYHENSRLDIYANYLKQLLQEGKAYYCYCTKQELEAGRQGMITAGISAKYSGHCRELKEPPPGRTAQVVRLKTPEHEVSFKDIIRGQITFDASLFGDFAIAKSLDSPLFLLSGAIDDYEMNISHVIRGEDHISNTPKQILIQKALGLEGPLYAHLPLILGPRREKLSKRYLDEPLISYEAKGYLPDAIINFLALLGWHPKDDKEVLKLEELVELFNLKHVQKGGAIFNEEKLLWINAQHIKRLDLPSLRRHIIPLLQAKDWQTAGKQLDKIIELERDRLKIVNGFTALADFFFILPEYTTKLLVWKNQLPQDTYRILKTISERLQESAVENLARSTLALQLEDLIAEEGRGQVLWPLRVALSGKTASPDPFDIMEVLGRAETLMRLKWLCKN